jgi:hypothetical protein
MFSFFNLIGIMRKMKLSPSTGLMIIGETGLESSIETSSTSTVFKQSVR